MNDSDHNCVVVFCGSFVRALTKVGESAQAMVAGRREDKSACISTTKVSSAPKSYVWSVHGSNHDHRRYSQNRCRASVNSHCITVAGASRQQGKLTLQNGIPVLLSPQADSDCIHQHVLNLQFLGCWSGIRATSSTGHLN